MKMFLLNRETSDFQEEPPYIVNGLFRYAEAINENMEAGNKHNHDQAWNLFSGFMEAMEYMGFNIESDYVGDYITTIKVVKDLSLYNFEWRDIEE